MSSGAAFGDSAAGEAVGPCGVIVGDCRAAVGVAPSAHEGRALGDDGETLKPEESATPSSSAGGSVGRLSPSTCEGSSSSSSRPWPVSIKASRVAPMSEELMPSPENSSSKKGTAPPCDASALLLSNRSDGGPAGAGPSIDMRSSSSCKDGGGAPTATSPSPGASAPMAPASSARAPEATPAVFASSGAAALRSRCASPVQSCPLHSALAAARAATFLSARASPLASPSRASVMAASGATMVCSACASPSPAATPMAPVAASGAATPRSA
mmetsp:Transcript_49740/g.143122  ORF Transcript_49740/g.143122 Transcript_49740/m.143122 type:complete len:270 (-) Transcript_49740:77-886(-)